MKHYELVVIDIFEYNNKDVVCTASGSPDNVGGWGADWPSNKQNQENGGVEL